MAVKNNKDYFGLSWIVSLILAIIPVTSFILGVVTRIMDGGVRGIIAAVLRIILGWNIIWIVDIIMMALHGRILRIF